MPHISSLARLSRNLYSFGLFALKWPHSRAFREQLAKTAAEDFDLVHFNHEGLFLLARWLRRKLGKNFPLTMHVRTHLPSTIFSRWQYRTISECVDGIVFITEMERSRVTELVGRQPNGTVIYNIVSGLPSEIDKRALAVSGFKIASASNYAWLRGNDRLIEIAAALKAADRSDIKFIVAGQMKLIGNLPGQLGQISARGGTLEDYAALYGVTDMFIFLGHVPDPLPILAACDILVRPSRNNDPWGREVLEAMALGLPVVAIGQYDKFVENGVTGVLRVDFDAVEIAEQIITLANSATLRAQMSHACISRIAKLCGGEVRAAELLSFWKRVVETALSSGTLGNADGI